MYEQLKQLIEQHNQNYQELNDNVHSIEKDSKENDTNLQIAKQERWQFIHNYASTLSDFLWHNMQELKPKDLSALDFVPYIVWNKIHEKSHIVVETIQKIHNQKEHSNDN